TFKTELQVAGSIRGHALEGDLVVVGGGDPTLGSIQLRPPARPAGTGLRFWREPRRLEPDSDAAYRAFDEWSEALRERGIRAIEGRIIGDGRLFDAERSAAGWPGQLGSERFPSISALNYNDNCLDFFWHRSDRIGLLAEY